MLARSWREERRPRTLRRWPLPAAAAVACAGAMCAPAVYDDPSLVKLLLDRGASATKGPAGMRGWTPLLFASGAGNVESVRLLLNAGADPNARAPGGQTPLVMAAEAA